MPKICVLAHTKKKENYHIFYRKIIVLTAFKIYCVTHKHILISEWSTHIHNINEALRTEVIMSYEGPMPAASCMDEQDKAHGVNTALQCPLIFTDFKDICDILALNVNYECSLEPPA